jgi:hypothetical protein
MGGACSRYVEKERSMQVFWWGDLREGDHLGDPGVDVRIILKWFLRTWGGGMDWIQLPQDRDSWWAVVNVVMNLRAP